MSDIDQVRLLIGDVTPALPALPHYTDVQIQAFITMAGGSVFLAAALALEAWAATVTGDESSESIGGDYSYTKKETDNKLALAQRYRDNEDNGIAFGIASMNLTAGSGITTEEE